MKLSLFKKLIREVIREELEYKFAGLEKKLNEVIVSSNSSNINKASTNTSQLTGIKKQPKVPVPSTKNSVLQSLLAETAQNDEWKQVEQEEVPGQSIQDNTSKLPEHLQDAFTKNYSEVLDKVDEKARFKNGS